MIDPALLEMIGSMGFPIIMCLLIYHDLRSKTEQLIQVVQQLKLLVETLHQP